MTTEDKKPLVVIGTSGSTDYLKDSTDKRYWPVREAAAVTIEVGCDGIHDDGAPLQYLCTRCFPDVWGDPAYPADVDEDDVCQDPRQEI